MIHRQEPKPFESIGSIDIRSYDALTNFQSMMRALIFRACILAACAQEAKSLVSSNMLVLTCSLLHLWRM